jgi:hypothetical protein
MRLRRTALPSAFLMLQPNRLSSRPLGRRKIVNSRLERRRPSRYTASYSARRATRHSRGRPPAATSDSREAVASLFAALRKDFPSTLTLHAFAEAVLLVTAAHMGLKRTFRQRILSSIFAVWPALAAELAHRMPLADLSEFPSVCDHRSTVKEGYGASESEAALRHAYFPGVLRPPHGDANAGTELGAASRSGRAVAGDFRHVLQAPEGLAGDWGTPRLGAAHLFGVYRGRRLSQPRLQDFCRYLVAPRGPVAITRQEVGNKVATGAGVHRRQ